MLFIFHKMAPNVCRETREDLFWRSYQKNGLHDLCGRKFVGKVAQKLLGQVWENSGKNPSHTQKFACSYTYVFWYIATLSFIFHSFES